MKTIQELYNEIMGNQDLKAKFIGAAKESKLGDFLKELGCESKPEDIIAFLKEKGGKGAQLSAEELDNLASGGCNAPQIGETLGSVVTAGLGCAGMVAFSAAFGHVGQRNEDEGRICNPD